MGVVLLPSAIELLQDRFAKLEHTFTSSPTAGAGEKTYAWPGEPDEDIVVCVHKSGGVQEQFHRHDYFYFNYTYKGQYDSLSHKYDHKITIRERELYAGQPYAGHALCVHDDQETIIIGVLIRRETFFRSFLPMVSANSRLFHFFLDPSTNSFSDEFIHFKVDHDCNVRVLLEMMAVEYAYPKADTQDVLKPLTLAFLMQIARQYAVANAQPAPDMPSERIVQYMSEHVDTVTLGDVAKRFAYHPNYVSTLIRKELGKSFSQILLEQRMSRAIALLAGTDLSVEEIALMLGYSSGSNFHKAFRAMYGRSPREYVAARMRAHADGA